ncbi:MAG: hypothetical protein ACQKBT_12840, partial [Puniceicoccales bacterium]
MKTNFIVAVGVPDGQIRKVIDVPAPTDIYAINNELMYVVSDFRKVLELNLETGEYKEIIDQPDIFSIMVSDEGEIFLSVQGETNQVKIYNKEGKFLRAIGKEGGRELLGPWDPSGIYHPGQTDIDVKGRLWITEMDKHPKRISIWDPQTGELLDEMFGPTHYGNSGAAIDSVDPNLMVSSGSEWRLNPEEGVRAEIVGTFSRLEHRYAVFSHQVVDGVERQYLLTDSYDRATRTAWMTVYERMAPGEYKIRSRIVKPEPVNTFLHEEAIFWADANDNQLVDEGEEQVLEGDFVFGGLWWLNVNPEDLSVVGAVSTPDLEDTETRNPRKFPVLQFNVKEFTECGAPVYDVANPVKLDYVNTEAGRGMGSMRLSPDGSILASLHRGVRNKVRAMLEFYDTEKEEMIWEYPNTFDHVHGSHRSGPPEPGLMRGAFGLIGTFEIPEHGTVFVLNGNCGEWYLFTEDGYYLSKIFQGDMMKMEFPADPHVGSDMTNCPPGLGGEDFGGMVTQTPDGEVYVQAGKAGAWNLALGKLDTIQKIGSGTVTITPKDVVIANKERERQAQMASGQQFLLVKKSTIEFTGHPRRDFRGVKSVKYAKQESAGAQSWVAYDDDRIYLGYEVEDASPWINGAKDPTQMYQSGDTVDFQIGTNPRADRKRKEPILGDLRVSIGNFKGEPTAVLYREVSEESNPREFTSSVIPSYTFEYVGVLEEAEIRVEVDEENR